MKLKIKNNPNLRILHVESEVSKEPQDQNNKGDPAHKEFYESLKKDYPSKVPYNLYKDFHIFLRDHHVDIILKDYVLILNEAVLEKDDLKTHLTTAKMIFLKKLTLSVDQVIGLLEKGFNQEEIEKINKIEDIHENYQFNKLLKSLEK